MFALIVLLLSVFCVCFNCDLVVSVLCLFQLCSFCRYSVFALIVLLLLVFCASFNCALAVGGVCLL